MITEAELRFSERKKLSKNALDFILKVSDIIFNIIAQLLDKDPKKRLGYEKGYSEIVSHPFFQSVMPEKIKNKKVSRLILI